MKNKKLFAMATLIVAIVILSSLTVTALAFTGYEAFEPTRLDELYTRQIHINVQTSTVKTVLLRSIWKTNAMFK